MSKYDGMNLVEVTVYERHSIAKPRAKVRIRGRIFIKPLLSLLLVGVLMVGKVFSVPYYAEITTAIKDFASFDAIAYLVEESKND